jgi:hypothetical protein
MTSIPYGSAIEGSDMVLVPIGDDEKEAPKSTMVKSFELRLVTNS